MASSWYKEFMAAAGVNVGSRKVTPTKYDGPPMDLANMRKNGVRALRADCLDCTRSVSVNVDDQPDHLPVPSFAKRMKCSKCGGRNIVVRPDWNSK